MLVRGSIVRASSASSVVIDRRDAHRAIGRHLRSMSRSRVTSAFLVMIAIGCRASQATSKQPRVRRNSPLGRLITIGHARKDDRFGLPDIARQPGAQKFGRPDA